MLTTSQQQDPFQQSNYSSGCHFGVGMFCNEMWHLTRWRHFDWNRLLSVKRVPHFILAAQGEGYTSETTEASFVWVVKATSHTNPVTCCKHVVSEAWLSYDTHSASESMLAVCVHHRHSKNVLQFSCQPPFMCLTDVHIKKADQCEWGKPSGKSQANK